MKTNRSDRVLVDFQYCHGNNSTIYIKELAFMGGVSIVPHYFLFRPPYDKRELSEDGKRQNEYCKRFIHGLDWMDGDLDYYSVGDVLCQLNNFKFIFVFGSAKREFLLKYVTPQVVNLETQTSFKKLENYITACPIHKDTRYKCALNNLYKLFVYMEKNEYYI